MAYDVKGPNGIEVQDIPDEVTLDEVMNFINQHNPKKPLDPNNPVDQYSLAKIPQDTFGKVVANLKTGVLNTWLGTRELAADTLGTEDPKVLRQTVAAKRQADAQLANSVTGGGALQTLGQTAPLAPLAFIPGAGSVLGAAAIGAAGGATAPVSGGESERMGNIIMGGALGGIGQRVAKPVLGFLGLGGVGAEAEQQLRADIGRVAGKPGTAAGQQLAQTLQAYTPGAIRASAAEAAQSPELAGLQLKSQAAEGAQPFWAQFQTGQTHEQQQLLEQALKGQDIGALQIARAQAATPVQQQAYAAIKAGGAENYRQPVVDYINQLKQGPGYIPGSPYQRAVDSLDTAMGSPAAQTPEGIHNVRKLIRDAMQGKLSPDSPLASVRQASAEVGQGTVNAIDQAFENSAAKAGAPGIWAQGQPQSYLTTYAQGSLPIDQARAQAELAQQFLAPGASVPSQLQISRALAKEAPGGFGTVEQALGQPSAVPLQQLQQVGASQAAKDILKQAIPAPRSALTPGGLSEALQGALPEPIAVVLRFVAGIENPEARARAYAALLADPQKVSQLLQASWLRQTLQSTPIAVLRTQPGLMLGAGQRE